MLDVLTCLLTEPTVPLPEVARRHRVHPETVVRWARAGLLVNGHRVRLEAIRFGRWRTSEAALARFAAAIRAAQADAAGSDPVAARNRGP